MIIQVSEQVEDLVPSLFPSVHYTSDHEQDNIIHLLLKCLRLFEILKLQFCTIWHNELSI